MVKHLYVHVPFCHKICPYCSFYKHTPGNTDQAGFVAALLRQLQDSAARFPLALETVYLGGGTPSMLSRTHLAPLLEGIAAHLAPGCQIEWVMEANPSTFDLAKAQLMRDHGVTRVSLGVQSWDPDVLETLGRDHTAGAAEESFLTLREAGFPSLNIDLMFAVPSQSLRSWTDTIDQTIALAPDHVSAYNLTYEEDTAFFERFQRGEYIRDEDTDAAFFTEAIDRFTAAGFTHYETSNYATPGHESAHNWSYWRGEDYLGIGPGAVSTIAGHRWTVIPDTARYIAAARAGKPLETASETLSPADVALERLGLLVRTRTGLPLDHLDSAQRESLPALREAGLVGSSTTHLVLTRSGKLVADAVAAHLAAQTTQ